MPDPNSKEAIEWLEPLLEEVKTSRSINFEYYTNKGE